MHLTPLLRGPISLSIFDAFASLRVAAFLEARGGLPFCFAAKSVYIAQNHRYIAEANLFSRV